MPKIDNLARKPFPKNNQLLSVHREDIFHRKDLRDGFGYAIAGIAIALAVTGGIYVIGKQLLK